MRTVIIAEIGVNHGGDFDTACRLVKAAAEAGADYAKFQTFKAESLVSAGAKRADYQVANCGGDETQLQMLRKLEISNDDLLRLKDVCSENGVGFMSSPFDLESVDFLAGLDMDYWKIPSGEITNLPYLERIASHGGKVIMSTGMSTIEEVESAVKVLTDNGISRKNINLLHCNTQYPTPPEDVNLLAMDSLRDLGCGKVGFSDHTQGIVVPVAAVAMGAEIIEKHFTYDKNAVGPDHKASADPEEFKAMVDGIRIVEKARGSSLKHVTESESANIEVARKSIVACRRIAKGELLTVDNITVKRPGTGISPMRWHEVIGLRAVRDFNADDLIEI